MPSRTSSSAFSAAARLCSSCSDNGASDRPDPGGNPLLVAEHGAARDQDRGAGFDHQRRSPGIDAAVDLDFDLSGHCPHTTDLVRTLGDELLATEPGLDRHNVDS